MDADDPNEILLVGLVRTAVGVAMSTAKTNPLPIGVHRRPSAVNSAFALIGG
jgi:hypothetical protein